ncbi:cation diffusion facilitator family transporter [Litorivivens sp.]|uniref:cation diffusion facilitator family transporter n=4 Tax=Gammaproteobacteria TaxID=1236 RepID=UPI0035646BE9
MLSPMDTRDSNVLRVILIEGAANLAVLLIKLGVGISTGSLAILGDAVHSLTDAFNNVVAWFVTRHSVKPADSKHPYGHRKFETVAVFVLATLLATLAFELAIRALTRDRPEIVSGRLELGLMVLVLVINIVLSWWQRRWAKQLDSQILLADANHTLSDVLITSSVIAAWQFSTMGWWWADQACALAVAVFILYIAIGLFKSTLPVLLDERAIDADALRSAVRCIEGVRRVSRVRSRWIGQVCAVDLVIAVNATLTTEAAHDIADRVEDQLAEQFNVYDINIHIEPFSAD